MLRRFRFRNALEKILSGWSLVRTVSWGILLTAKLRAAIRRCERVIFIPSAGFGHSIHDTDLARRLFPGQRCLLVFLSGPGRHNPEVGVLWSDAEVFFLPTGAKWRVAGRIFLSPPQVWLASSISRWLRWMTVRAGGYFFEGQELYQNLIEKGTWPESLLTQTAHLKMNFRWPIFYFHLRSRTNATRPRLPESIRSEIEKKLPSGRTRVGIYLRQKGLDGTTIIDRQRTGSPLESYLPAIRWLVGQGYQVLICGDAEWPSDLAPDLVGEVLDARSVDVPKTRFDLYAATEVALFIGESGGGIWLPELSGIPVLMLNALPYSVGIPHAQIFYQLVRRPENRKLVSRSEIYAKHSYDYLFPGFLLEKLGPEHILAAVQSFIKTSHEVREPRAPDCEEANLPPDTWIRQSNTRFSQAFIDLYRSEG